MKIIRIKFLMLFLLVTLLVGCGTPEPTPKRPSEMTQEERTEELRKTLAEFGIVLPDNWEDMTKQERGAFLLGKGIIPPETERFFEE